MIQYIEAKSILSKLRKKDTYFGISYNMNFYRGCQHACIYCDTDILQDISKTYAAVSFTITSADDSLSQKIEPHAPPTSERFKAMRLLADKGIYTGVTLMPILPFVNDTKENITTIVKQAKESGASYIIPMFGVTLRKGSRE